MKPLGDPLTHLRLVRGMAKATNTDIVSAYDTGTLSPEAWAEMVERCRACTSAEACTDWLWNGPDWQEAPGVCRNKRVFAALKSNEAEDPVR
ncbi:MAG: DUF6455 family protein [Arenibacterium sp.]